MESTPWPFDIYGTTAFLIATSITPRLLGGNRHCRRRLSVVVSASAICYSGHIPPSWLILAALTVVSGSAPIRLYSIPVALSVSETFVFTSVILFGPAAGTLTVVLDAAVISFWSFKRGQKLFKIVFNVCALPLTIWIAAHLFFAVGNFKPLFG